MDENKNPFKEEEQQHQEEQQEETLNKEDDTQQENEVEEAEEQQQETDEKYEELNNKYIRLAADFDNFRKRTLAQNQELAKYTTIEILKKLTAVLDTFDRAREHLKNIDNCDTVKESYEVAYKQLVDTLNKLGLVEIEALGKAFNPEEHEAITQVPSSEFEPDTVALVAQKGYKLEDKVVRPALVGVATAKEE